MLVVKLVVRDKERSTRDHRRAKASLEMEGTVDERDGVGSEVSAGPSVTISVAASNNIANQVAIAIRALGAVMTTETSADSLRILACEVDLGAKLQLFTACRF